MAPVKGMRTQSFRLMKETTYGTAPATVVMRPNALRLIPHAMLETEYFAASGDALASLVGVNDDYTTFTTTGKMSFTDLMYPLGSMFGAPVTTTPGGATLARLHTWTWDGNAIVDPVSFTFHWGDSGSARQFTGGLFNTLSFGVSRDGGIDMSSDGFGKAITTGVTGASTPPFAASPTQIAAVPMFPLMFDVYRDTTWAGIGTTKVGTIYACDVALAERFSRARPINSTLTTDGIAEAEGDETGQAHNFNFTIGVDTAGEAMIADLRAGTMYFWRIQAAGATNSIESGQGYLFQLDFAHLLTEVGEYGGVQGGILSLPLSGRIAKDPTSGNGVSIKLKNKLTQALAWG